MTNYNIISNGFTIPVTISKMNNRCNLYSKWDTFEVIADPKFTVEMVQEFVESRKTWMDNHLAKFGDDIYRIIEYIGENNISLEHKNKEVLRKIIKKYIQKHENALGEVNRVYIRSGIRGRWASCSEKHNITFSDIMCYLPEHLIEYIVYHEMCHLTIRNHGAGFYKLMCEKYPDYVRYNVELDAYHYLIAHKEIDDKIKEYANNVTANNTATMMEGK